MTSKSTEAPKSIGRVSHICIYPVKGAAAIEVSEALLRPNGIEGDREFMVVRGDAEEKGGYHFITQRDKRNAQEPKQQGLSVMALIKPELHGQLLRLTWDGNDPISIRRDSVGKILPVKIWSSSVYAVDQGSAMAEWLSDHLKTPARLVKVYHQRRVSQSHLANDNTIRFQDAYPVHWFSEESVTELSKIAGQEISWKRFRPNLVVRGGATQSEHLLHNGTIGSVPFVNPKPCDRCPVTMVNQENGELVGPEPLRSLAKYKRWKNKDGEQKVIFGENMLPLGSGLIKMGDEVVMRSLRSPPLVYGSNV